MPQASDLKAVLKGATNESPLYFHSSRLRNIPIKSIKRNESINFPKVICQNCNTTATQPFDRAWQERSRFLRTRRPILKVGDIARSHSIFRCSTNLHMKYVHLFFLKKLGCYISAHDVPAALSSLADVIKNKKIHPKSTSCLVHRQVYSRLTLYLSVSCKLIATMGV
jgi:hypothetical protein